MNKQYNNNPLLICLGEILIDLFPAELGRKLADVSAFQPKPGGAPANVAVAISKLGCRSAFIGKVGHDAFGELLVRVLRDQGVDVKAMRIDNYARTTLAFIAKPDENSAEYIFYRNPGADLMLKTEELDGELLKDAKVLHIGSLSLVDDPALSATHEAIHLVKSANTIISFDVNYRPSLWDSGEQALRRIWEVMPLVNLLKVNENELMLLTGSDVQDEQSMIIGSRKLIKEGPELVVVTLGEKGSFFCTKDESGFMPAFKVKTVDAVGCGDAFIAGLLTRLARGEDWHSHLNKTSLLQDFRFANAVGALTSTVQGVIPALPSAKKVEEFLSKMD